MGKIMYKGIGYGGGGNSNTGDFVDVDVIQTVGTKIATININNIPNDLYAPGGVSDVTVDGVSVLNAQSVAVIDLSGKQNVLTPGNNIDITNNVISATDTTYSDYAGSAHGLVPAPSQGDTGYLKIDGTWAEPEGTIVEANPSDTATETLSKILIDDTVYSLAGGTGSVVDVYVNGSSVLDQNNIAQIKTHRLLTQTDYDALTTAQKNDGTIYFVAPDSISNYTFASSNDGTCVVRINNTTNERLWFFNNYYNSAGDMVPPTELSQYVPSTLISTSNYPSGGTIQNGWVGFYNNKIRSWTQDTASLATGYMWGVIDIDGQLGQIRPYEDPYEVLVSSDYDIYYINQKYTKSNLTELSDIDISNPTDGQVLKYNGTTQKWENGTGGGGASALDDLTDVNVTTPSDGQVLTYDATNNEWVNSAGGGGGGTTVIANPSGTATDELEKIQIGSTIYEIPTSSSAGQFTKIASPPPGQSYFTTSDWIDLTESMDNFDALMFVVCYMGDITIGLPPSIYPVSYFKTMSTGAYLDYNVLGYGDVLYISDTRIQYLRDGGITLMAVYGIKYGGGGGGGNADYTELTQAEYDALPDAEKYNGELYFITDGQEGGGSRGTGNCTTYGYEPPTHQAIDGDSFIGLDIHNSKVAQYLYMVNKWVCIDGGFSAFEVLLSNSYRNASDSSIYTAEAPGILICFNQNLNGEASTRTLTSSITTTGTVLYTNNYDASWSSPNRNQNTTMSIIQVDTGDTITLSNTRDGSYTTQLHLIISPLGSSSINQVTRVVSEAKSDNSFSTDQTYTTTSAGKYVAIGFQCRGNGKGTQYATISTTPDCTINEILTAGQNHSVSVAVVDTSNTTFTFSWGSQNDYATKGYAVYKLT